MKKLLPFYFFAVFFILSVAVIAQPANDNFASATDVSALINTGCTSGGAYTNVSATSDQSKGSCWSGGPYANVWFKFTATSTGFINIQVKVNGSGETLRYPMVALWNSTPTQLQCQNQQGYGFGTSNLSMSYYGLTPGTTYYFSVDDYASWGTTGKFDLCISDVPDYDYPQGATDLTSNINTGCSTGGTYSNQYATADNGVGSCWSAATANHNRWFKFTATSTTFINVQVKVSGSGETMRYPMVALWDASLSTQLQCQNQQGYGNGAMDLSMSYYGLTPGATYYIEVDDYQPWGGSGGTFDMCLSDVTDYDYPQGATDLTSKINIGCTTGGTYSNQYATADNGVGSCWSAATANHNRWFKFTATSTTFINVQVKVSGSGETMRYPMVALWNSGLTTQLQCQNQQGYGNGALDLSMSYYGLTPGATYYIEVDDYQPWGGSGGTFDMCLSDQPDYDYPQGATDLTSVMNGCSTGGTYSNQYATADNGVGSCWSSATANHNRWFKFTASSTTFINVQVKVSGSGETMRYPMVALWNSSLSTVVQCQNQQGYGNGAIDLSMSYYGLTVGATYYIEVDTYQPWGGSGGTFDICVSDQPDYDYPEGAVILSNVNNYCSTGGNYSNSTATADHNKGSCWSDGPNKSRWFKFQAVSATVTSTVTVNSGQTMRYPMMALWTSATGYTTQLACTNRSGYGSGANNITLSYTGLTVGNWYYISVDYYSAWGNGGTFDICINNATNVQYYSIGTGDWSNPAVWATTGFTGTTAGTTPSSGNIVNIRGQSITVSTTQSCNQVNMADSSAAATNLIVDNALLTVYGTYNQTNRGANSDVYTTVQNSGTLTVNNNAAFTRNGGANNFQLNIENGSVMNVGQDMTWTSSSGSTQNSLMNINGTGNLNITRDLTLTSTGGPLINLNVNNSGALSVGRDITFTSNAAGKAQLSLNNTSNLNLSRNFVRGATPYGTLSMASTATLSMVGATSTQTQNIVGNTGSGGDSFNYTNVTINNTSGNSPSVFLTGAVTITGALQLTRGVVQSTSTNSLLLTSSATCNSGASNAFISGPMTKAGNSAFVFPLGKNNKWARLAITAPSNASNQLTAEYFKTPYTNTTSINSPLVKVSQIEYWTLSESITGDPVKVTLYWENASTSGILNYDNTLSVAHWNGSSWDDIGQSAITAGSAGNITSNTISSFSPFTFGSKVFLSNPLPVELLYFDATPENNQVNLIWQTATENNSDYFTVEKSQNGIDFIKVMDVKAAGQSTTKQTYHGTDTQPFEGVSYYRLKQTDLNGDSKYYSIVGVYMEKNNKSVLFYPNPVSHLESLAIQLSGYSKQTVVLSVRDIKGNEVVNKSIEISENQTLQISEINSLSSGTYIVTVQLDGKNISKTIIVK